MTNSSKKSNHAAPGDGGQVMSPQSPSGDEGGNGAKTPADPSTPSGDERGNGAKVQTRTDETTADGAKAQAVAGGTAAAIAVQSADEGRPGAASARKKASIKKSTYKLTPEDLTRINSTRGLKELLRERQIKVNDVLNILKYEDELVSLQVELVKLQRWLQATGKRVVILFEGRDAAGKGGTIRRFTEHLNPRSLRVVALPKPTEEEKGQWYFQRYSKQLPNKGEIVFFDRSWYNRAVVEPVNGFCTEVEYDRFMQQVPEYEHMLYEDGITIIKFWFSISKDEQLARFESRQQNPLKQWKLSPIDHTAQKLWDRYTEYKEQMFSRTHTSFAPWIIVRANNKRRARLESIRHVLSLFEYTEKDKSKTIYPDPTTVERFNRNIIKLD